MKALAAIILIFLPAFSVFSEEAKPYNVHEFSWKAEAACKCEKFSFSGRSSTTRVMKAFRSLRMRVNELARKGEIKDGILVRLEIVWRGRKFVRYTTAHSKPGPWEILPRDKDNPAYDPDRRRVLCPCSEG